MATATEQQTRTGPTCWACGRPAVCIGGGFGIKKPLPACGRCCRHKWTHPGNPKPFGSCKPISHNTTTEAAMTTKAKAKKGGRKPDAKVDPTRCACTVEHHRFTTIQGFALYNADQCSRKHVVTITHKDGAILKVCRQHAKLAARGFVDSTGRVMSKASRSDYQTFRVLDLPPDLGKWSGTGYENETDNLRIDNENARRRGRR